MHRAFSKNNFRNKGRSKYGAKRTTVDGITFASKREAKRYTELKLLEDAGEILALELQRTFPFMVNGHKICSYRCDFVYTLCSTGERVVEDVKGFKTPEYKIKAKLFIALYGQDYKFSEV